MASYKIQQNNKNLILCKFSALDEISLAKNKKKEYKKWLYLFNVHACS